MLFRSFQMIIAGFRWNTVLKGIGIGLPFWETVRLFYVGTFFNQALPGGTGGDVVREHILKLLDVLWVEEAVQSCLWKLGEGLVRGREDSERAGTRQSVNELAGLEGGDEGGEVGGGDSEVDDRGGFSRGSKNAEREEGLEHVVVESGSLLLEKCFLVFDGGEHGASASESRK